MEERPDFTRKKFTRLFNLVVDESAFAIFIQSATSKDEARRLILDRVRANASYGLNHVVIHGIGPENIRKIRKAVGGILDSYPRISKPSEDQAAGSIHVFLEFPPDIISDLTPDSLK